MTVYLACIGAYSDRRVIGVYSDEATALAVAQAADRDGRAEPFDIDAGPKKPEEAGMFLWWAMSSFDGPEIDEIYRGVSWYRDGRFEVGEVCPAYEDSQSFPLLVYVYAHDEEHARKIAADKLREHFALWGTKEKP